MQAFYLLPSTFHFSLEKNVLFFFFNYYCFFAFNIFCLFIYLCFQPLISQHGLDPSLKAQIMKEKKSSFLHLRAFICQTNFPKLPLESPRI